MIQLLELLRREGLRTLTDNQLKYSLLSAALRSDQSFGKHNSLH